MLKRLIDILAASAGLLSLAPLFAVIAVAIKLDSAGPVFFRQERVGRHGVPFRIFKFRSMVDLPLVDGPQVTVEGDQRITRVGAFLRRSKLDELPQLIDVLRGTMSLVGPRPEVPRYVERYPPEWRHRLLTVRPGITDFASVRYRDEGRLLAAAADPEREYVEVVLPMKLRYSLQSIDNASVVQDLKVIGLTLRTLFVPSTPPQRIFVNMNTMPLWTRLDRAMSALKPRNRTVSMLADAACILACWHVTYLFRLGFERWQPGRPWYDDYVSLGVMLVYLVCMAITGVPRGLWRFFGFDDFKRLAAACAMAGMISAVTVLMAQLVGVARAVLLLHPVFCALALSLMRMIYRIVWEYARARVDGSDLQSRRAIVLGAGDAGRRLVVGLHRRDGWTVLALLDDDPAKQGLRIGGVTVEGTIADLTLPHILAGATHVVIAMPGVEPERRAAVAAFARQTGLTVLSVPARLEPQAEGSGDTANAAL